MGEAPVKHAAWIEIVSAIVLATAGLLTTWVGFQADLWTGVQAARYAEYGSLRMEASRQALDANQVRSVEVSLFSAWLDASAAGEAKLAEYYRKRFPPNLSQAFEAWRKLRPLERDGAPGSPFEMPNYRRAQLAGQTLDAKAVATFDAGQTANTISDKFSQGNVMLAMSMFFAGIAQVFRIDRLRMVLLAVAVLACGVGMARVISLPLLQPG